MPTFEVTTRIHAPIQRVFDLSRDIGFHVRSLSHTGERVVAGRTDGLIQLGETVTWEARHLGVRQRLTVSITACNPPLHFRDEMLRGAFKTFTHDHHFEEVDGLTTMTDRVAFTAPLGPLGWLAERVFLRRYLRRLITGRARAIRAQAQR